MTTPVDRLIAFSHTYERADVLIERNANDDSHVDRTTQHDDDDHPRFTKIIYSNEDQSDESGFFEREARPRCQSSRPIIGQPLDVTQP